VADLSITPGNVKAVAGSTNLAIKHKITAGATITAGQTVYLDTADGKYKLADANVSAAVATVAGIALTGSSDGQELVIQTDGDIDIGATTVLAKVYVLSDTAGGIQPVDDSASTEYVSIIGVAISTSRLRLGIRNSGAQKP